MTKLKDLYPEAVDGDGIFDNLADLGVPWADDVDAEELNTEYFLGRSGNKNISTLVNNLTANGELTTASKARLARIAFSKFGLNWSRLWDTLQKEYDPVENYSMIETHTGTDTGLQTPTNWKSTQTQTPNEWTETQTQTPNDWKETQTQTPNDWKETQTQTPTDWKTTTQGTNADNESDTTTSTFAFDSVDPVPTSKSNTKNDFKTETEQSGTMSTETSRTGTFETETEHSGTFETETTRTGTFVTENEQSGTMENKTTYNTTLTRRGNIGVTTTQQMQQSSFDLWRYIFFDVVYENIDSILTLSIY